MKLDRKTKLNPYQFSSFCLFLGLLSPESDLCGHDPLSLSYEGALCAEAVAPTAVALVAFQGRHDPMVATPGANVMKYYTILIYTCSKYSRVFVPGKPFQLTVV